MTLCPDGYRKTPMVTIRFRLRLHNYLDTCRYKVRKRGAFLHFGVHNKVHFYSKEELLMKRILVLFFAGIVLVGFCMTQSAQSQGGATASGQSSVAGQSGAQVA